MRIPLSRAAADFCVLRFTREEAADDRQGRGEVTAGVKKELLRQNWSALSVGLSALLTGWFLISHEANRSSEDNRVNLFLELFLTDKRMRFNEVRRTKWMNQQISHFELFIYE